MNDEKLRELVRYVLLNFNDFDNIKTFQFQKYICGCIGCMDGFSQCPCNMYCDVFKYRSEIIDFLISKNVNLERWENYRNHKIIKDNKKLEGIFDEY